MTHHQVDFRRSHKARRPAVARGCTDSPGREPVPNPDGNPAGFEARVIVLEPNDELAAPHGGDVLVQVMSGSGQLTTEEYAVDLTAGRQIWLPRRVQGRRFTAGPGGLRCVLVQNTG
ncbi:hypothetical protein [Mycobacterium vicinigordonae]|uniref:Cupin n=1 Tax=Mycobacterium vicinigordonae TaxID=1719132 RepID=A0A7D6E8Z6_9MYCO|nr:hypothetical protein [Mycobacterium vicinigordonae]QLL07725.1 hypothetical protein H0P51_01545 [Mycobacterium vicinigordonae]